MPNKSQQYGVTIDGEFYPVTDKASWQPLREALDNYVEWVESRQKIAALKQHNSAGTPTVPSTPEGGQPIIQGMNRKIAGALGSRAIDALLLALDANGGQLSYKAAVSAVAKQGWDTSSSARPDSMISVRAKHYPDWIDVANGRLTLKPAGREMVQEILCNLGVAPSATTDANSDTERKEDTP